MLGLMLQRPLDPLENIDLAFESAASVGGMIGFVHVAQGMKEDKQAAKAIGSWHVEAQSTERQSEVQIGLVAASGIQKPATQGRQNLLAGTVLISIHEKIGLTEIMPLS